MNNEQKLWWKQARSDHALFVQLRGAGVHECHLLHYLQMATEKVSKAYFWRSGHAPPKSHTGTVLFLKALLDRRPDELDRVARVLEAIREALFPAPKGRQRVALGVSPGIGVAPRSAPVKPRRDDISRFEGGIYVAPSEF